MLVPSTDDPAVIVVTGAAGGIGRSIVLRLAARGFRVAALDVDEASLKEALVGVPNVHCMRADVTAHDALVSLAHRIEAEIGPVVGLVNNAGVFIRTPTLPFDARSVRDTLAVNLEGALACTSAFAAGMSLRKSGRIVNVASIAAYAGAALATAYAASKAGLVAATQSQARELATHGISVNAVLPGYCRTAMLLPDLALATKFVVPRIPWKRVAEPDEIAEVIEMLLTLRTPYLTGAAIPIDGGLHVG
jgi:NAD(P)-dependent dehydrogenase (short-subunit alcohol dehydrogenase family)